MLKYMLTRIGEREYADFIYFNFIMMHTYFKLSLEFPHLILFYFPMQEPVLQSI